MNIVDLFAEYPNTAIVLAVIGGLVTFVVGMFLSYLLWHILGGFFTACSYMRWSFRVMKANGRKPIWRRFFSTFFSAWGRHIGNDSSIRIYSGPSIFRGYGNYTVVGTSTFETKGEQPPAPDFGDEYCRPPDLEPSPVSEEEFQRLMQLLENDKEPEPVVYSDEDDAPELIAGGKPPMLRTKKRWPKYKPPFKG